MCQRNFPLLLFTTLLALLNVNMIVINMHVIFMVLCFTVSIKFILFYFILYMPYHIFHSIMMAIKLHVKYRHMTYNLIDILPK